MNLVHEMYPASSGDENKFIFVNVEELTDTQVEEEPKPTSAVINTQSTVSCVSVCVQRYAHRVVACHSVLSVCLSVCPSTEAFGLW